jgi:hypothetical protein
MNPTGPKTVSQPAYRRYVVHILCMRDHGDQPCHYVVRIRPSAARIAHQPEAHEKVFADEYELIAAINPLLPSGSDVRDVFSHIDSPPGFFYILSLSAKEASQLGWRG